MTGAWSSLAGVICLLASAVAISLFHRARAAQGRTARSGSGSMRPLAAAASGPPISSPHAGLQARHRRRLQHSDHAAVAGPRGCDPGRRTGRRLARRALVDGRRPAARSSALGVAAMHYTGMMGLELPARIVWSPGIVAASIAFGSLFGALAPRRCRAWRAPRLYRGGNRSSDRRDRLASFHRDGRRDARAGSDHCVRRASRSRRACCRS